VPSKAGETDSRFVPAGLGRSEIREKASRFFGLARRVESEAEAREWIAALEKEHHDATHVCYAWRIRQKTRAADAGEPPQTAGRPILSAIELSGLDEAAVAVVRYFGGTKLGTAGLVRCYREAARLALESAARVEVFETETVEIRVPYDRISEVKALADPPHVVIVEEEFTDIARFRIRVRKSRVDEVRRDLRT
jgi:uncharacterized YigZ family protein